MAVTTLSGWRPIEVESFAEGTAVLRSAVFEVARRRPMSANQVDVPRLTDADVDGGSTLTDDTNLADVVSMYGYLYNGKRVLDEAEVEDSPADAIESAAAAWLNQWHIAYDNASIGVSGARSGTVGDFRPYTSIYKAVRTNDNSGAVSYTADANYSATGSGGLTYANANTALGKVESGEFWNAESGVILFHPGLKEAIRGIVGTDGRPIFVESTAGMPGGGVRPSYSLFGLPAYPTHGAIVSSNFKRAVATNKLIVFANRQYLVRGDRVAPEGRFIPADINTAALQHTLVTRARQGFVLTVPNAASVLEVNV